MRVIPYEVVLVVVEPDQCHPHERCLGQVKTAAVLCPQITLQFLFLFFCWQSTPIRLIPEKRNSCADNLQRLVNLVPEIGAAQNGVPIKNFLPCALEGGNVEIALNS